MSRCQDHAVSDGKRPLELHHRRTECAQNIMKTDTSLSQLPDSNACSLAMDLRQVMFVPTLTHSEMFYRRQLLRYNFGVCVCYTMQSYMCMGDETIASGGANEIVSCLLKLSNMDTTNKKYLIIWSDNCAAQNKTM
ncbi:hypothetical protein ANN_13216 [Periplaneta americana]|uniref:Uncharacterized protein n=1 Tax=Periplaneta americana TaxID=6978 RepID=A0ABQ8TMA1_PERAM|nr:hypothetical protein ANN_13216 [Periplaneta americana]